MAERSVVVTGIGLVTPLGRSAAEVLARVSAGDHAGRPPARFLASPFACPLCAAVGDFDAGEEVGDLKAARLMGRDAQFAAAAARRALSDAGTEVGGDYAPEEVALFGSTGLAGISLEEVAPLIRHSAGEGGAFDPLLFGRVALKKVRPVLSFKILSNMPACFVSILLGLRGPNAVYAPWEGQGAQAILEGLRGVSRGDFPSALVGGCDAKAHELAFVSLQQQGLFAAWERCGAGCVPGEGAVFLFLEEERRARSRGARIRARVTGWGSATEGAGVDPVQARASALEGCCRGAGLRAATLLSSGDGDPETDRAEETALGKTALRAARVLSPKKSAGNLFAAAAALQVGLAAALSEEERRGPVLAACFGHGETQAAFLLEHPSESRPARAASARGRGRRRVVVTGLGVVSPVGNGRRSFWQNLAEGVSGIGPITLFDAAALPVRIGGEVRGLDMDALEAGCPEAAGERDRKVWLGLAAASEALADAGLSVGDAAVLRSAALFVGVSLEVFFLEDVTAFAGEPDLSAAITAGVLGGGGRAKVLQTPLDRLARLLGDLYGISGPRVTNCSACAAGAQVVGEAFRGIREGEWELALAGAADSMLNPLGVGGFALLGALSTENEDPPRACRPFDATRQGTVLGEGAAFLVLEEIGHARSRGANMYAEVLGYGASLDAYRISDPDPSGRGAVRSMSEALEDARLAPEAVDCVSAHGTGTPKNDAVETSAIKQTLGGRARRIPVHAVKSTTGHLIAASGALEVLAGALTLREGVVPPTVNLESPDPECDLDYVPGRARRFDGRSLLTNSFGFGGQNASLVLGRLP